jgi:hypothetical protein
MKLTGKDDDEEVNDELRDLQGGQVLLPLHCQLMGL